MHQDFKGIFTALTTPFEGENISPAKFHANISKYNEIDLAGYVIGGSTGESVYLTNDECISLVKTAKKNASPGRKIIAGTDRESTKNTLDFTNRAADEGIDAALICLPHYYRSLMNTDSLKKHYLTIAEQSRVPILIYSIPRNTGIMPTPELIIELSQHPNILGIKDSSGNLAFCEEVCPRLAPGSAFFLGAGSIIFPGLLMGASGGILTLAAAVPELCSKLYRLFLNKKWEAAKKLQLDLVPLNQAVTKIYGVPGAKYVLDLRGLYGGPCRLPLLPLEEKAKQQIKKILTKLNIKTNLK